MASGGGAEMAGGALSSCSASSQQPGNVPQLTAAQFSRLSLTIEKATLNPTSYQHYSGLKLLSKPNLYVELVVDGKQPRKTEFCKGTYQPRWNGEPFIIPVTPYSKFLFRLFDHSSFKKDALVAEASIDLYPLLVKNNGKCQMFKTSIELFLSNPSKHSSSNGPGGSRNSSVNQSSSNLSNMSSDRIGTSMATNSKAGELSLIFDGLNVDMSQVPTATPTPATDISATAGSTLSQQSQGSITVSSNSMNNTITTEGQETTAINNTAQQNGITGMPNASHSNAISNVRPSGGRAKRNSSGSSQSTTDQAGPSSSGGRLPPLSSSSSDNKKSGKKRVLHYNLPPHSTVNLIRMINNQMIMYHSNRLDFQLIPCQLCQTRVRPPLLLLGTIKRLKMNIYFLQYLILIICYLLMRTTHALLL